MISNFKFVSKLFSTFKLPNIISKRLPVGIERHFMVLEGCNATGAISTSRAVRCLTNVLSAAMQEVTNGNRLDFPPAKTIRPHIPQVEQVSILHQVCTSLPST